MEKIKNLEELIKIILDLKKNGMKIIWTNGCFDILHAGHTHYLKEAKKLGDRLIVGLNSDCSVRNLKGENRPINNQEHRAEVLSSLESVDYIIIFNETSAENYLRNFKPDFFVKAGDYNLDNWNKNEKNAVEEYIGQIKFIPVENKISTTEIINKIKQSEY